MQLHMVASQIKWNDVERFKNVILLRSDVMHIIQSVCGAIGKRIKGSGAEVLINAAFGGSSGIISHHTCMVKGKYQFWKLSSKTIVHDFTVRLVRLVQLMLNWWNLGTISCVHCMAYHLAHTWTKLDTNYTHRKGENQWRLWLCHQQARTCVCISCEAIMFYSSQKQQTSKHHLHWTCVCSARIWRMESLYLLSPMHLQDPMLSSTP